jgi:toxin ParE1/3/4
MRLDISDAARRDLRAIYEYGRESYGENAAQRYLTITLLVIDRIPEWPFAARLRKEVRPPVRLLPHEAHNIFYDVGTDTVTIVRVLHHSADWVHIL